MSFIWKLFNNYLLINSSLLFTWVLNWYRHDCISVPVYSWLWTTYTVDCIYHLSIHHLSVYRWLVYSWLTYTPKLRGRRQMAWIESHLCPLVMLLNRSVPQLLALQVLMRLKCTSLHKAPRASLGAWEEVNCGHAHIKGLLMAIPACPPSSSHWRCIGSAWSFQITFTFRNGKRTSVCKAGTGLGSRVGLVVLTWLNTDIHCIPELCLVPGMQRWVFHGPWAGALVAESSLLYFSHFFLYRFTYIFRWPLTRKYFWIICWHIIRWISSVQSLSYNTVTQRRREFWPGRECKY